MQKSPFNGTKCRLSAVPSPTNRPNAATEWFHQKFGAAIQLSERAKNESARKQKRQCYYDVKKDLEKRLATRRHEALERRYSFYNAENELFEDEGNEEEEEEEEEEELDEAEGESGKETEEKDATTQLKKGNDEEEKAKDKLEDEEEEELEEGEEIDDEEEQLEEEEDDDEEEQLEEEEEQLEEEEKDELQEEQHLEEGNRREEDDDEKEEEDEEVEQTEAEEKEEAKRGLLEDDYVQESEEEVEENEMEDEMPQEVEDEREPRRVLSDRREESNLDDEAVKRKLVDLFDDEASLSGDDVGSEPGDESQEGLDEYEAEAGDLDQLPDAEEIRENLVRQFLKHQNDDSDRQLLKLQEAFFADSDLHGQGANGDRSFRFRMHADANVDWAKLLGSVDEDNEGGDEEDAEERQRDGDEWHQKRIQMIKWRAEEEERKRRQQMKKRQRTEEDADDGPSGSANKARRSDECDRETDEMAESLELDAPLFALGEKMLWTSCNNKDANATARPLPSSASSSAAVVHPLVSSVSPLLPPKRRRDSLLSHRPSPNVLPVTDCALSSPSVGFLRRLR